MSLEAAFSPQQHYVRFRITFPGKLLSTKRSRFVPPVDSPYSNTYTFKILPAQRPAVEPIGRLCTTRFKYITDLPKNIPTKTPVEGQFGSNRVLGAFNFYLII